MTRPEPRTANAETSLVESVERRLRDPLPGRRVQEPCAVEMSFGRHFGPLPHDARPAAVMALLFRRGIDWRLPLIVRPPDSLHHAGQVSLPGGAIEPGEEASAAALREVEEELGVDRNRIRLLGRLSPLYVFTSNHYVQAFVGQLPADPTFELSSLEVARLLEYPLDRLVASNSLGQIERQERGIRAKAPAYHWDGEAIWGATCMILAELAAVLREASVRC